MDTMKIKVEYDGKELILATPEDASPGEMVDSFITIMTWMTFPQAVTERAMANYLAEHGWDEFRDGE